MLDFNQQLMNIVNISREDRALLRSNLSARLMPEDGQEHMFEHVLLSSSSSFGFKAINLLSWCFAPTKVNIIKHIQPVRHLSVYSILGEHQLAEDAAQETFARALINLNKLKNNNNFGPWLAAICRNVAKDMLAEKVRQISSDDLQKISQNKKNNENNRLIHRAIEQLPVPMKELVVLRYYDGLSYEQISSVLGISKASINGRLTRAKRKMANYLKKMDLSENRL